MGRGVRQLPPFLVAVHRPYPFTPFHRHRRRQPFAAVGGPLALCWPYPTLTGLARNWKVIVSRLVKRKGDRLARQARSATRQAVDGRRQGRRRQTAAVNLTLAWRLAGCLDNNSATARAIDAGDRCVAGRKFQLGQRGDISCRRAADDVAAGPAVRAQIRKCAARRPHLPALHQPCTHRLAGDRRLAARWLPPAAGPHHPPGLLPPRTLIEPRHDDPCRRSSCMQRPRAF